MTGEGFVPVRNSSIRFAIMSMLSPVQGTWSSPGSSSISAFEISLANSRPPSTSTIRSLRRWTTKVGH
ncbi:hypothetical protein ACFSZS_20700 [Seohaeicola zhoushanensis]